jgi:hypothetical protein
MNIRNLIPFLFTSVILTAVIAVPAQKLKPAEIVARHLDSVGKAEDRAALKDATVLGTVRFSVLRTGGSGGDGNIVFTSSGEKTVFGMTFKLPNYPNDTVIFDGRKVKVTFPISNARSPIGDFLYQYNEAVNKGVFGGTLTTGWALYESRIKNARIESEGKKKVDGVEYYAVSYLPKGGSDLEIRMFFDMTTFRHVRTEYRRTISAIQGSSVDNSSQRRGQRQLMVEEFGDFKEREGLTLPHRYKLYILNDGETGTREYEWTAVFSNFLFNQGLDPNTFAIN